MVEAFWVWRARARGLNARPRNREPVALQVESLHQGDILREKMILVTSDIARGAASNLAYGMRKPVPDGLALTVKIPRTFYLVRSRRHAPEKSIRKFRIGDFGGRNCTRDLLQNGKRHRASKPAARKQSPPPGCKRDP